MQGDTSVKSWGHGPQTQTPTRFNFYQTPNLFIKILEIGYILKLQKMRK